MEEDGAGGLAAVAFGAEEDRADGFGCPSRGGEEKLTFSFTFNDEQAVQAEVVHVDSVREVAAGILFAEFDTIFEIVTGRADFRGDGLSGLDCDFEGLVGFVSDHRGAFVWQDFDGHFGGSATLDFAESLGFMAHESLTGLCGHDHFTLGGVFLGGFWSVRCGVNRSVGDGLSSLDGDGGKRSEAWWKVGELDGDGAFELIEAIGFQHELASAAWADGRTGTAGHRDRKIFVGWAQAQFVPVFFTAEVARIGDSDEVFAVFWGGEVEHGVFAAGSPRVVVIFVEEFEDGQSVGRRDGAGRERADHVGGGAEGVGDCGGVEVGVPGALSWVDHESGVGSARVHPEFYDFAVAVEKLVEFHFAEVLDAKIIGGVGVFTAESEP